MNFLSKLLDWVISLFAGRKERSPTVPEPVSPAVPTAANVIPLAIVYKMFPGTLPENIQKHLPIVLRALDAAGIGDRDMVLMALATIRAETASFRPIAELRSKYNTQVMPFDLYDYRKDLGNQGPPDGEWFRGRGFVQLTGRRNYKYFGGKIGLGNQLVESPDLACDPEIAARLLAVFLKAHESKIRAALSVGDLARARRLVNGGSHGLKDFTAAFNTGKKLWIA